MTRRTRVLPLLLTASVWSSAAQAQLSVPPDWAERPDSDSISSYYPRLPLALEIEGEVFLSCRVAATGVLEACSAVSETPAGLGFAPAALRMSRTFQMRPAVSLGDTTPDDEVRIPIRFKLPGPPPPAPAPMVSPAKAELVHRLVRAIDPLAAVSLKYESTARSLEFQTLAGAPEDAGPAAAAALRRAVAEGLPKARLAYGRLLAQRLSEAELTEAVRFAETPEGRRYLSYDQGAETGRDVVLHEANESRVTAAREAFCALRSCAATGAPTISDPRDPAAPLANVDWAQQPTPLELARAWPVSWMVGLSGFAQLSCEIGLQGAPESCEIAAESPAGVGLGKAALALAGRYRVSSQWLASGASGRKVTVIRYFAAPGREPTAIAPPTSDPSRLALARQLIVLQEAAEPKPDVAVEIAKQFDSFPVTDEKLRADIEAALLKGAPAWRAAVTEGRARLAATRFDEATLRAAIAFESGAGGVLLRASIAERDALKAIGEVSSSEIAATARTAFCAGHACAASPPRSTTANRGRSSEKP